jgi:hypothetical protein
MSPCLGLEPIALDVVTDFDGSYDFYDFYDFHDFYEFNVPFFLRLPLSSIICLSAL